MKQEDEVLLQILRHRWESIEELLYNFIASNFEKDAGFPIAYQFFIFYFLFYFLMVPIAKDGIFFEKR
jgi:hypothetical protein